MSAEKKLTKVPPKSIEDSTNKTGSMPFSRANYTWLIVGIVLLVVGYVGLLIPSEFVDSKEFSFSLYIAPWFILSGFLTLIYAILKN
ncbi:MAG: DUF3098 domain-containing protein [Bacteroidia bacterium]|nr:DUF3098 domain-containing protein [Bacteroidia bacterium]